MNENKKQNQKHTQIQNNNDIKQLEKMKEVISVEAGKNPEKRENKKAQN